MSVALKGLDRVFANLNREIGKITDANLAGLWDAGLQIQRASQKRVPVLTGNLKGSHYTRNAQKLMRLDPTGNAPDPNGSVKKNSVEIGATAAYAVFVHENMEAKHPRGGMAKFLERAITDNMSGILEIITRRAKM